MAGVDTGTVARPVRWTGGWLAPAVVLLVAAALRIVALHAVPPPIYCDEASIALEADCLGQTGRDSFGRPWPLYVESLGDFKGPVFVYAAIPFVRLLGLSAVAVRLTAALFGIATVALAMRLAWRLLDRKRPGPPVAALTTGALLAVSPWHVFFSRAALEAISLPFLVVLGLVLLVEGTGPAPSRGDGLRLAGGAAALALTPYAYAPAKATVPLLALAFALSRRRELRARAPSALLAFAVGLAVAAPAIWFTIAGQGQARYRYVGLFSEAMWPRSAAFRFVAAHPALAARVGESRPLRAAVAAVTNYALHLDPRFWLVDGDPKMTVGAVRSGLVPIGIVPLLLAGLVAAFRRPTDGAGGVSPDRRDVRLLLAWLAIGPLAASLTLEEIPHATRCLPGSPAFELLAGAGAVLFADALGAGPRRRLHTALLSAGVALSAVPFLAFYFSGFARVAAPRWESDVARIVAAVERQRGSASSLELRTGIDGFWALYLFHIGAEPRSYQGDVVAAVQRRFDPRAPDRLVLVSNEKRQVVLVRVRRGP